MAVRPMFIPSLGPFPSPPQTLFCPECDRQFVADTRADVERLFDEHLGEVRNPDAHSPEPF